MLSSQKKYSIIFRADKNTHEIIAVLFKLIKFNHPYTFVEITRPIVTVEIIKYMAIIPDTLLFPIRFMCHYEELISSYVRSM